MAADSTNVILSGDHKQLGPIIRSSVARELGLEKSYLERLMENELYDEKKGHQTTYVLIHSILLRYYPHTNVVSSS
jgi:helicase MOV-10